MIERKRTMGPAGDCICIKCGFHTPHQRGVPCREMRCPQCGSTLLREGSDHHRQAQSRRSKRE